jgi:hypothetical protein
MKDELIDILSLVIMCLLVMLVFKIIVIVVRNETIARQVIDFMRQLFM